jgi:HrpA-like RNA helicase
VWSLGYLSVIRLVVIVTATKLHRQVIISTNIAETSITIDDIGFVIDGGKVTARGHNLWAQRALELESVVRQSLAL